MRRGYVILLAALALPVVYLLTWPVPVDPVAWDAPADRGLVGDFAPNNLLAGARAMPLGDFEGPEDVTAGHDGKLYATTLSGDVVRITAGSARVSRFAHVGGRPLGIETDRDGTLVIANAYLGLQRVSRTGEVTSLLDTVNGEALRYANDLAIGPDGTIYFSESSTRFAADAAGGTLGASLLDILEHSATGRVLAFDPATGTTRVIVDGLAFANGVAISDDAQFLVIAETGSYRVLRHWLLGPRSGRTEVLRDNLPGFPDNVNPGLHGRFWIGLVAPRNRFLDSTADKPLLRKMAQRLPAPLRPKPEPASHVFAIDENGQVLMNLQDTAARIPLITGVLESPTTLYLTTLEGKALYRLNKDLLR